MISPFIPLIGSIIAFFLGAVIVKLIHKKSGIISPTSVHFFTDIISKKGS